jgi:hypothetical protein
MSALALGLTLPFSSFGAAPLTPPTVAPVLTVDVPLFSYQATLEWTASNKTTSSGFGYSAHYSTDGVLFVEFYNSLGQELTTIYDVSLGSEGLYYFKVVPFNATGDGPESNVVSVDIPGI